MSHVYILRCEQNKWYIGHSRDIAQRIHSHMNKPKSGSKWTRMYKPIEVEAILPGDIRREDELTIAYMSKYGVDNVRGGKWASPEIRKELPNIPEYIPS
ncbi:MAG: GIY-YIG nuclease family protein [Neptuniibacter sp.]